MLKTLKLAKREYYAAVKTKGFIIGLILMPVFMGGGLIAVALMKDRVDTSDKRVAVIDRSGVLANVLIESAKQRNAKEIYNQETGKKIKPAYNFEIVESRKNSEAQRLQLSNRVRNGSLHAFVEIGQNAIHPGMNDSKIAYYAKNALIDEVRSWIELPINDRLRALRLKEVGIETSTVKDLFYWVPAEGMGLVSVDTGTGAVKGAKRANAAEALGIPIVMLMLMFMMIMMGAMPLLSSVMEEKGMRIAEVLLGSITPFEFMTGKVAGSIGVSLTSALVYVLGGIFAVKKMGFEESIPYNILPWFFAYMVLAIIMFGALFAAIGSACNDPRDAQSLSSIPMFLIMIPMFLIGPLLQQPNSTFSTALSLFPTFTPFMMLMRVSMPGGVPMWQPWLGLFGMLLFATLFVWGGGRIFRICILSQGAAPKLRNLVRWAIRG
jgi:ABC-2 type transport system permease protein